MFFFLALFLCSVTSIYCASSSESTIDCRQEELSIGTLSLSGKFAPGKYASCMHSKMDPVTCEITVAITMAKSDAYKPCRRLAKYCIQAIDHNTETDDLAKSIKAGLRFLHKNNFIVCVLISERNKAIISSCINEDKHVGCFIDEYDNRRPYILLDVPVALSANSNSDSGIPRASLTLKH